MAAIRGTITKGEAMTRNQIAQVAAEIGSGLMPDNDQWTNRFTVPSTSKPGEVYVVAQRHGDKSWGCSCWAWRRQRRCKHLDRVLARLAKLAEQAPKQFDASILTMLASARTAYLDLDVKARNVKAKLHARVVDL